MLGLKDLLIVPALVKGDTALVSQAGKQSLAFKVQLLFLSALPSYKLPSAEIVVVNVRHLWLTHEQHAMTNLSSTTR